MQTLHPLLRALAIAGSFAAAGLAASAAQAATVFDPQNDFLPSYTGPHNGDLDVKSANVLFDGTKFTLTATLWGDAGSTKDPVTGLSNVAYVWGVNRGAGGALLNDGAPNHQPGLRPDLDFDEVIVVKANGDMFFQLPTDKLPTRYDNGKVTVEGATISGTFLLSDLASTGFSPEQYTFSLWPKFGQGGNVLISDFGPDKGAFSASVPEPAAWALLILGFGGIGGAARARRAARPQVA